AVLDALGTCRIDGLYPAPTDVIVRAPGEEAVRARVAGTVDLSKPGDGRIDLVLERERRCKLHVTVDDEKRLPATVIVWIATAPGTLGTWVGPVEEDPGEAVLRFSMRPDPRTNDYLVNVVGRGCPTATAAITLPPREAEVEASVALVSGARLVARVLPAS